MDRKEAASRIASMLTESTLRLAQGKICVLFSGGVDSTALAVILRDAQKDFLCVSVGFDGAEDSVQAAKAAEALGVSHEHVEITLDSVEKELPSIAKTIPDNNAVKTGVGIVMWFGMRAAKAAGCNTVFSGLGSEELFAGYERHAQADDINKACAEGIEEIQSRDLDRDNAIAAHYGVSIALPFLDEALVKYSLALPAEWKIEGSLKKVVLRDAALLLGVPEAFALRKKRACQYGSRADWALEKLARRNGYKFKRGYVGALS